MILFFFIFLNARDPKICSIVIYGEFTVVKSHVLILRLCIVFLRIICLPFNFHVLEQITIGIHTGEVVTGVIGQRMPRFCLFGNTVNLTSRTETTGQKGKINVSEYTYRWDNHVRPWKCNLFIYLSFYKVVFSNN